MDKDEDKMQDLDDAYEGHNPKISELIEKLERYEY